MAGGGVDFGRIADFSEIVARMQAGRPLADGALFDQRPGDLEATRGLEPGPVLVLGRHDGDGWKVLLHQDRREISALTPEAARALAAELVTYADLAEGRGW